MVRQLYQFRGHKGAIYSLTEGLESGTILSAGSDGCIVKWYPGRNEDGEIIARMDDRIFSIISLRTPQMIFAGTMSGDLYQLQVGALKLVKRFRFHMSSIFRMGVWNDLLIVIGGDGIVSLWNPINGEVVHHLQISNSKLRSLCIDIPSSKLITGDANGNVWILKLPGLQLIDKIMKRHETTVFSLAFLQNTQVLISGGLDAHLKITNETNELISDLNAHWFCINDICDLTGTNYIATASRDKSIRIWDKRDWSLAKEIASTKFVAHSHSVNCLLWNQDEKILYSAGDDGVILAWKIEI
jgi:WD40 repeat protein